MQRGGSARAAMLGSPERVPEQREMPTPRIAVPNPDIDLSRRPWMAAVHAFHVVLLGLVLPLLCWSKVADPGHAHQHPHFVFSPAPLHSTLSPAAFVDTLCRAGAIDSRYTCARQPAQTTGEGQAVPDTLVLFSFFFLPLLLWTLHRSPGRATVGLLHAPLGRRQYTGRSPTPPPRRLHPVGA